MQYEEMMDANRAYNQAQMNMEFLPNYYKWIYNSFRPYIHGEVIELGCGAGIGIAAYLDYADHIYAVDHDPELLDRVKARFPRAPVTTIEADLLGPWTALQGLSVNTVVLMDVIEHFANDFEFLSKAASLLKPGGHLAIKVPAQSRYYSEMDRASGHFRRYDPEQMHALSHRLNLRTVRLRYMNRLGGFAYRFRNRHATNFSRTFTLKELRAINFALPLVRWFDLLPGLPGLSLIAVLQTEGSAHEDGHGADDVESRMRSLEKAGVKRGCEGR